MRRNADVTNSTTISIRSTRLTSAVSRSFPSTPACFSSGLYSWCINPEAGAAETEPIVAKEAERGGETRYARPGGGLDSLCMSDSEDEHTTAHQGQRHGTEHKEHQRQHFADEQPQTARLAHEQVAPGALGPLGSKIHRDDDERDDNDE